MVRSVLVGLTGPGRASAREVIALVHAVEARVAAPVSKSQLADQSSAWVSPLTLFALEARS